MGLKYPPAWKFDGIGFGIPPRARNEFMDLVLKIADGDQIVLEGFKKDFGGAGTSSSFYWAIIDTDNQMAEVAANAAYFLDCLWTGVEDAARHGNAVPDPSTINRILAKHGLPLEIRPPDLVSTDQDSIVVDEAIAQDVPASDVPQIQRGELLGEGGYGRVYRATKTTSIGSFEYALKELDPHPFVEDADKARRRFEREVQAVLSLEHRAIVRYIEAGVAQGGRPYLLMPLVCGTRLDDACRALTPRSVVEVFVEILEALDYAHNQGVLHRDLKPKNILLRDTDRQPIILDFGCAYFLDELDTESLTTQAQGTVGYIPIEVLLDPRRRSERQDVYAVAVMLYEVFAMAKPDSGDYRPLEGVDISLAPLDAPIRSAIAGFPDRTRTAAEFATQLRAAAREVANITTHSS